MINKVILIGRTPRKPSLKEGKSGTKYCAFSIATNSGYGDKKQTDWHDITVFGTLAERCSQYIDKGSLVGIEGRISYDKYEKDGKTVKTTKIIANDVTFLSPKGEQDKSNNEATVNQANQPTTQDYEVETMFTGNDVDFDSVPF